MLDVCVAPAAAAVRAVAPAAHVEAAEVVVRIVDELIEIFLLEEEVVVEEVVEVEDVEEEVVVAFELEEVVEVDEVDDVDDDDVVVEDVIANP